MEVTVMDHSVCWTLSDLGRDEANGSLIWEAIEGIAPGHDPLIALDLSEHWLSVTLVLEADDAANALDQARPILASALRRAGLPMTRVIRLEVSNDELALPAA
jgi:hypothetical protein